MAIQLKTKEKKTDEYRQLKTKLFFHTLLLIIGAAVIIWAIYSFFLSGRFANWVVSFFENGLHMEPKAALSLYQQSIRNYMEWFIYIPVVVVFFVLFAFYLNQFTKYFYEISKGIDKLTEENTSEIALSPELSATEKKLNTVRQALEKRKMDAILAEQRKNDVVVYLAHDLKTPLTSVIGYLTLLHDETQISEELKEKYLSISLDKAERLEDLINEFFEITRVNLSNIILELSSVSLARMLEQIVYEFKPMLAEKNLKCTLNCSSDIMIKCDANKMQRVFDNLLRNAVNYSFEDSKIDIMVTQGDKDLKISFINQGNTISEEKLDKIFEQFYRLDNARATQSGGAGLGLAIAKEIIESHGGTITAQSENERIIFIVDLPQS